MDAGRDAAMSGKAVLLGSIGIYCTVCLDVRPFFLPGSMNSAAV
jgi:hypothetical protein